MPAPTEAELRAAFCWRADDLIPGLPAMTAFRREARVRPVGSPLPLDYARTFTTVTLEALLGAGTLPRPTVTALRDR